MKKKKWKERKSESVTLNDIPEVKPVSQQENKLYLAFEFELTNNLLLRKVLSHLGVINVKTRFTNHNRVSFATKRAALTLQLVHYVYE